MTVVRRQHVRPALLLVRAMEKLDEMEPTPFLDDEREMIDTQTTQPHEIEQSAG